MKTYRQLSEQYKVHPLTIRDWVEKAGMKPNFLQPGNNPRRGGLLCILDDTQQEQLHNWLVKTGRIK